MTQSDCTDEEVIDVLHSILDATCSLVGRQITVFLPQDPEGYLLTNRSVNYLIKEIEKSLHQLKREEE